MHSDRGYVLRPPVALGALGFLVFAGALLAGVLSRQPIEPLSAPMPVPAVSSVPGVPTIVSCVEWEAASTAQRQTAAGQFWWESTRGRRPSTVELDDVVLRVGAMCALPDTGDG